MARILIVDDHIETCRVMAMLVKHLGYESHALNNGADVADYLKECKADLVILDIMMPGINGMDVLRQLRADAHTATVPVIMMTAVTDPLTKREAMDLGANDYWIKATIEVSELEQRLRKFVSPDRDSVVARLNSLRSLINRQVIWPQLRLGNLFVA